jgi:hypothetical protein
MGQKERKRKREGQKEIKRKREGQKERYVIREKQNKENKNVYSSVIYCSYVMTDMFY